MAVTVKMFWLAASILLVLQLSYCSPGLFGRSNSISEKSETNEDAANADSNTKGNKAACSIKNKGSAVVQTGKTVGSTTLQLGKKLPGYILGSAKSTYAKVEEGKSQLANGDNKPGIVKRNLVYTPRVLTKLGVDAVTAKANSLKTEFTTQFNQHGKSIPEADVENKVTIKRVATQPINLARTLSKVTIGELVKAKDAVINNNNGSVVVTDDNGHYVNGVRMPKSDSTTAPLKLRHGTTSYSARSNKDELKPDADKKPDAKK